MSDGENIEIFLMDGSANGIVQCIIGNWIGIGFKIPRIELDKCSKFDHLKYSGVYFLFGKSDDEEKDAIYIGQAGARQNGEGILYRLQEHDNNPDKDFWTEAIVFTTRDGSMGSSEISYLEHRFFSLAKEAGNYNVVNGNTPSKGGLSGNKPNWLEKYINYAKLIVNILGHKAFEKPSGTEFFISHGGKKASCIRTDKGFIVLAGSYINKNSKDHLTPGNQKLRAKHEDKINKDGELMENITFSSPSAAAIFVLGRSANGNVEWKTADGKTLGDVKGS
jgi:hypothetical protein